MEMKVENPPNIDLINYAFPNRGKGVIYAYGDTIYNPSGAHISSALHAHEAAHGSRQLSMGCETRQQNIDRWWDEYILDPEFRYQEELVGHAAEYLAQEPIDRNARVRLLTSTALRLIAPMYEFTPNPRLSKAIADLRKVVEHGRRA